jgi:hypothetical protein
MALVVNAAPDGFRPIGTGELNYVFTQAVIPGVGYHIEIELNGLSAPKGKFYPDSNGLITCNIAGMLRPNLLMSPTVSERLKSTYVKYQEVWDASSNPQVPLSSNVISFYAASNNRLNKRTQFEINTTGLGSFLFPDSGLNVWPDRTAYIDFLNGLNSHCVITLDSEVILYVDGLESLVSIPYLFTTGGDIKIREASFSLGSITDRTWRSSAYGNGIFVAVSIDFTNQIAVSPDGITWSDQTAQTGGWNWVCYADGKFIAVGNNKVMTSPDGLTWTSKTAAAANNWQSVVYSPSLNRLVAVSLDGAANRVMTSDDLGDTWTIRVSAENNQWRSVTFGNGLFVAVADTGVHRVMTSPDGITWTTQTAANAYAWSCVTYGNGFFIATNPGAVGTGWTMRSADGSTWVSNIMPTGFGLTSISFGGNMFFAIGDSTDIFISNTGIDWNQVGITNNRNWKGITYGPGGFVVVGAAGGAGDRALYTLLGTVRSVTVPVVLHSECRNPLYLKWLNDYGGLSTWLFDEDQRYNVDPTQTDMGSYPLMGVVVRNLTLEEWEFFQGLNRPGAEYGDNKKLGAYVVDFTDEDDPINIYVIPNLAETQTKFRKNEAEFTLRYPLIETSSI